MFFKGPVIPTYPRSDEKHLPYFYDGTFASRFMRRT